MIWYAVVAFVVYLISVGVVYELDPFSDVSAAFGREAVAASLILWVAPWLLWSCVIRPIVRIGSCYVKWVKWCNSLDDESEDTLGPPG